MEVLDDLQAALDGRYEIVRELGRGGMAVVYLARDLKHDRQVAIKVLPPELATSVGAERFLREIRTAAQLTHPNILPLHDSVAEGHVRCYVMPYVQGESLRHRIDRERQLGIEQAVDLARQVAAGLDYAHAHGIVHRDIKPENILLVGDQAMIADFGLARAVNTASSAPFTGTGIAVGTPAYMSPEQAAADSAVDGRTDVYALGCMFFEMVSGMPPFRGATLGALLAAHATRTPPSLCAERPSCPAAMDAAVQRALAKVPADRFRTAGDFVHALESWRASAAPLPASVTPVRRAWLAWAAGLAAVLAAVVATPRVVELVQVSRTPLDSNAVVLLPVSGAGGRQVTPAVAQANLSLALGSWRGLRVVDAGGDGAKAASTRDASGIARRNGAGMLLSATVSPLGDSVAIQATLRDVRTNAERQRTVRVADDGKGSAAASAALVAALLRAADGDEDDDDGRPGTTSLAAWRAFTRGDSARRAWSLPAAEREFRRATDADPSFARANLWLAQVLAWQHPEAPKEWGDAAGRALALHATLSPTDSMLAVGLVDLAGQRYPQACASYEALRQALPRSDLPWYGLAMCQEEDAVVVRAAASPSGWRFRASAHAAAAAVDSALARAVGAPAFAFRMLGALLVTEPSRRRRGQGPTQNGGTFLASPSLQDDTIAYVPYPMEDVVRGRGGDRSTLSAALQRNNARLYAAYVDWVRRAPDDGDALGALASIQEARGDAAAVETVRRARALAADAGRRLRLAVSEVRLLAKQGRFDASRQLADSLLLANPAPDPTDAQALAGVAALVGKVEAAGTLLATAARARSEEVFRSRFAAPAPMVDAAAALLSSAAAGVCSDSLRAAIIGLERMLAQYVTAEQRDELRRSMLLTPSSLAMPCLGPRALLAYPPADPLVRLQQRLAAGDMPAVRAQFAAIRETRVGLRPGDVALEHTLQEALVLVAMRDTATAASYLDLSLTALPTISAHVLDYVPSAFALGRSFAVRADLAAATGDTRTARRNAAAVAALWRDASPSLQPLVQRMARLAH